MGRKLQDASAVVGERQLIVATVDTSRATRSLARATWFLAIATVISLVASLTAVNGPLIVVNFVSKAGTTVGKPVADSG